MILSISDPRCVDMMRHSYYYVVHLLHDFWSLELATHILGFLSTKQFLKKYGGSFNLQGTSMTLFSFSEYDFTIVYVVTFYSCWSDCYFYYMKRNHCKLAYRKRKFYCDILLIWYAFSCRYSKPVDRATGLPKLNLFDYLTYCYHHKTCMRKWPE